MSNGTKTDITSEVINSSPFELGFKQHFYAHLPECYVEAEAAVFPAPSLLYFNRDYANELDANFPNDEESLAALFAGQAIPKDAKPIAQAYAGHQFGHFNPQLGDGRAMILGELIAKDGSVHELDLKGSGPTPFSRGGDGKAALGPMLREVLIAEAMHALGIPTTRALAVAGTSESVYRDPVQPGAVLARTGESHVRIGTFQFFAAREQYDVLEKLVDFCLSRHYSSHSFSKVGLDSDEQASQDTPALHLLRVSIDAQAQLIAKWMGVGFIHGVMNTDNMLIGAQTIDYGPCAFMDTYNPNEVFSSIDRNSRYAYSNQPGVAQWNLSRFAETLLPLIHNDKEEAIELATQSVRDFNPLYEQYFRQVMCEKLALEPQMDTTAIDDLIAQWLDILHTQQVDWTNAHYQLACHVAKKEACEFFALFKDAEAVKTWLRTRERIIREQGEAAKNNSSENVNSHTAGSPETHERMFAANPIVIPRNHLVEDALKAASEDNDMSVFNTLLQHLTQPFDMPNDKKFTQGADKAFYESYRTFCGT